jgi:hypothetical protein
MRAFIDVSPVASRRRADEVAHFRAIKLGGNMNRTITDADRSLTLRRNDRFEREMARALSGADFA